MRRPTSVFDGIEKERQLRIAKAVSRGEAVADQGDAALAVAYAQSLTQASSSRWRWLNRAVAVGAVLYLAMELAFALIRRGRYEMPTSATVVLFVYVASHISGWVAARRRRTNARRAGQLNLQLLQAAGVALSQSESPEPPVKSATTPDPSVPSKRQQWIASAGLFVGVIAFFAVMPPKHAEGVFFLIVAVFFGAGVAKALEAYPSLAGVERVTLWWWLGTAALLFGTAAAKRPDLGIATAVSMAGLGLFMASNLHGVADRLSNRITGVWVFRTKLSARDWRINGVILAIFAPIWASNLSQFT
jgi:hypothetical protein